MRTCRTSRLHCSRSLRICMRRHSSRSDRRRPTSFRPPRPRGPAKRQRASPLPISETWNVTWHFSEGWIKQNRSAAAGSNDPNAENGVNAQSAKTRRWATVIGVPNDLRPCYCVRRDEGARVQPMVDQRSVFDRNGVRRNCGDVWLRRTGTSSRTAARAGATARAVARARSAAGHAPVLFYRAARSVRLLRLVTGAVPCAAHADTWRNRRLECSEKSGCQHNGGANSLHTVDYITGPQSMGYR
jgi:hypothetical protein